MKTEIFLVKFENKAENRVRVVAVGDLNDVVAYSYMKTECEWKDLDNDVMKDGWTVEKKMSEVAW